MSAAPRPALLASCLVGAGGSAYDGGPAGNGGLKRRARDRRSTGAYALSSESSSLVIRRAAPGDAAAIARVHVETWRSAYAGMVPDRVLLGMTADRHALQWSRQITSHRRDEFVMVAEYAEHGVIGFGSAGRTRGGDRDRGEVFTLYVHPDCQGLGAGRRLLGALFEGLGGRGMLSAVIWVLADNPSRFFYEAMGGVHAARRHEKIWGERLPEFAYSWETLEITAGAARA